MAEETAQQMEETLADTVEASSAPAEEKEKETEKTTELAASNSDLQGKATILHIEEREEFAKDGYCNRDVFLRLGRFVFLSAAPVFMLSVLTASDNFELSLLIGIGIECMYVVYFASIAYLFWSGAQSKKGRYLFRVWTRTQKVPGWAKLSVATHQQLYQFEAIQSISEFSAIDGGIPASMLANLGPFTWAVVVMHFASELHCNETVFHWDWADAAEMIGVCGLMMIGFFELDPYNPGMKFFHYVGAGCGLGTVIGYVVQQWSLSKNPDGAGWALMISPVFITILAISCFFGWQWSNKMTVKYQDTIAEKYNKNNMPPPDEMKKIMVEISRLSLRNVYLEGIFLFCGATCLALWLMHYDESCDLGCAGVKP